MHGCKSFPLGQSKNHIYVDKFHIAQSFTILIFLISLQYDEDDGPIDPNEEPFSKFEWLYPKTTENFSSLHIEYGVSMQQYSALHLTICIYMNGA